MSAFVVCTHNRFDFRTKNIYILFIFSEVIWVINEVKKKRLRFSTISRSQTKKYITEFVHRFLFDQPVIVISNIWAKQTTGHWKNKQTANAFNSNCFVGEKNTFYHEKRPPKATFIEAMKRNEWANWNNSIRKIPACLSLIPMQYESNWLGRGRGCIYLSRDLLSKCLAGGALNSAHSNECSKYIYIYIMFCQHYLFRFVWFDLIVSGIFSLFLVMLPLNRLVVKVFLRYKKNNNNNIPRKQEHSQYASAMSRG